MVPPPCFAAADGASTARVVPLNRCGFATVSVPSGAPAWHWAAPGRTAPAVAAAFIYGASRRRWRRVRAEVAEMLGKGNFTGPSCPLSRRLKDVVFVKEMRDAITSGEFALKLAGSRGLAAMNYQSLCNRLHVIGMRLEDESLAAVDVEILPPLEAQKCLKTVNQISEELESRILKGTPTAMPESGETGERVTSGMPDPRRLLLYIREDQTVDLDGALNEARKVAKFSGDLWERLNGQGHGRKRGRGEAFGESEAAKRKRKAMEMARQDFEDAEEQRKAFVAEAAGELNQAPEEARTQDYLWQLRSQWRQCEQRCRSCRSLLLLRSIEWSLQCSAEELEKDLQQTSMSDWAVTGQQQKLQVAELALMEKQAASYQEQAAEHLEELEVLEADCAKFAARLGLKSEEGPSLTPKAAESGDLNSSLRRLLSQVKRGWERTKSGLEFYTSGLQLLWQDDIQYACNLVSKAAFSNYTLRAWEVRTLQRTVKDLLTLIPFLIILIIPLSPVGHVLVFSFFQKNFPEFFPSSFTEQRQNVTKIYRDIVPEDGDDTGR
eukprot:s980_g4.t1